MFAEIFSEFPYKPRRCNYFRIPSICTLYHGSKNVSFLRPEAWNILLSEIKPQTCINSFKNSVKNGSRKIAYADPASVSFLHYHKGIEIYCMFHINFWK